MSVKNQAGIRTRDISTRSPRRWQSWFMIFALAGVSLGCGAQAYESRLKETNLYFKYREKLDKALDKRPFEELGVSIRVPLGFTRISAGNDDKHDARQPTFFKTQLPGLMAAWQKNNIEVEGTGDAVTELPAWMFLCTNHQRWLEKTSDSKVDPLDFRFDIAQMLAAELSGYSANDVSKWQYHDERVPRQNEKAYVPRKDYSWIILDDTLRLPDGQRVEMEVMLTVYFKAEIQLALISVAPKNLARRDNFYSPIQLCMETLEMTGEAPRPKTEGPKTGGGF